MLSEKEKQKRSELYEWVRALVCTVLAAVLLFTFVVRVVVVDGESMRETLQDQDILLALCDPLCGTYEAGDIVVLSKETFENGNPIIKRVIATEGQWVDIDFEAGIVYVNGNPLEESYTKTPTNLYEGVNFPLMVEDGCVFVMGDNRNESKDSRSPEIGQVDKREILGKAIFLFLPGKDPDTNQMHFKRIGALS